MIKQMEEFAKEKYEREIEVQNQIASVKQILKVMEEELQNEARSESNEIEKEEEQEMEQDQAEVDEPSW